MSHVMHYFSLNAVSYCTEAFNADEIKMIAEMCIIV